MGRTTSEHRLATSRTLAAGLMAPVLLISLLDRGGLAPIAIAAVTALMVGAPAALAQWRVSESPLRPAAAREAVGSATEMAALLWASCAIAHIIGTWGPPGEGVPLLGWLAMPLVWLLGLLLSRSALWLGVTAALSVLALLIAAGAGLAMAKPPFSTWTLLEPRWESWASYAGSAATLGVLLAGVGIGPWTLGAKRPPGERHAPWAAVGLGLLATTALAVERSARYESALGAWSLPSVLVLVPLALMLASAAGALLARGERPRREAARWRPQGRAAILALAGLLLTALLAGPASGALPLVVGGLVPALALGEVVSCMVRRGEPEESRPGRRAGGLQARLQPERLLLGLAAAVLLLAAVMGWPGLPARVLDAALLGAFVVGTFWVVATRSVLARRSA